MLVIVGNDLIEKLVELVVCVMRSGINSDTRFLVGYTRENAHLERNTFGALHVLVFFPNFFGAANFALRFGSWLKEEVVVNEIITCLVSSIELVLWFLGGFRNA